MDKLSKSFLGNEIVVYGCTKADNLYYKRLYRAFSANGIKVYGLPTQPESELDFEVYPSLDAMPHVPSCAFVLCPRADTVKAVGALNKCGVKRFLFYSRKYVSDEALEICEKNGIEVRLGCPLMLYASGPCLLHAAAAGAMSERKA